MGYIPIEIQELIIDFIQEPEQRFKIATYLRLLNIQKKTLPLLKYASIDYASRKGQIDLLNKWKNSGLELKYTDLAMNWASQNGHITVLDWWKNASTTFGLELKYNDLAMELASQNGHVKVLNWWKNNGLELKYTEYAMDYASKYGHVKVLNWWKTNGLTSGLEFKKNNSLEYANMEMNMFLIVENRKL